MTETPRKLLDIINRQVDPLNPPVREFENSIRTSPFRILISILLSSRTKDKVTMEASEKLFRVADTPELMVTLNESQIRELIYPVGFYKQKAKNIAKIAKILTESNKSIPDSIEELTNFPGVGRKTANLVLALAFKIPTIAVDIHVFRISRRLGWAISDTPDKVEEELKILFPESLWIKLNQTLVGFGQTICKPRNPSCSICKISDSCIYYKNKREIKI